MIILKMTVQETAADELTRYSLPNVHIRFQLNIRSRFRFLTADHFHPNIVSDLDF
jgi:hypothetical protein